MRKLLTYEPTPWSLQAFIHSNDLLKLDMFKKNYI